jgi:hypothetical protein
VRLTGRAGVRIRGLDLRQARRVGRVPAADHEYKVELVRFKVRVRVGVGVGVGVGVRGRGRGRVMARLNHVSILLRTTRQSWTCPGAS